MELHPGNGAAFSFIAGKVKEAPKWMQKTGLEWLFRLPQQPGKTISRKSASKLFSQQAGKLVKTYTSEV
jgi:exopolysaccharide biosynthesis WecB/TagA/CpsF family protein